jgi:hypothetical protein
VEVGLGGWTGGFDGGSGAAQTSTLPQRQTTHPLPTRHPIPIGQTSAQTLFPKPFPKLIQQPPLPPLFYSIFSNVVFLGGEELGSRVTVGGCARARSMLVLGLVLLLGWLWEEGWGLGVGGLFSVESVRGGWEGVVLMVSYVLRERSPASLLAVNPQ